MIDSYGWSAALQHDFSPWRDRACEPARIVAQHRDLWRAISANGEIALRLAGRFAHEAATGAHPVVGDWVAIQNGLVHGVLPRRSAFSRPDPSGVGRQILCANVDRAVLVMSLNGDLNPRRLERYLAAARDGGAEAAIVLTKADLCADPGSWLAQVAAVARGASIAVVSATQGVGIDAVRALVPAGATAVLLGSSGAGKSTLLNALMGEEQMAVGAIRDDDDKGRHTTRHRALFALPHGGLLIDTPGLRELAMAVSGETLEAVFDDIADLSAQCRFKDCSHTTEPGCAITDAIDRGDLSPDRWRAYQKLQREAAFEARRSDVSLEAAERRKWKQIGKNQRAKDALRRRNAGWDD